MAEPHVVIVGAGPVGLAAALFLVERGIAVTVLEAEAAVATDMRASTFHPPTLDMLAVRGIAARLVAEGHVVRRWQYAQYHTGKRAIFDLSVLDGLTDHPFRLQCEQFRLTRAIVDALAGAPLFTIRFGARVVAAGDGWVETGDGGRFESDYVIAADGGRSALRTLLDLPFEGESYPRTSITVGVEHDFAADIPGLLPVNYLWTADEHFSLMRVSDHWRVGFSPLPGQGIAAAVSEAGVEARLQAILPRRDSYRIRHVGHYTVHRRAIDRFVHGRTLFAGDAAHLNSPSGGMGMNSGVHDARCLVDHLVPVLAGGDPALLERYDRRRRTIAVEEVQAQSDRNYRRHRETDPARRVAIWAELERTVADRAAMRAYLFRSSMLASLERERAIL